MAMITDSQRDPLGAGLKTYMEGERQGILYVTSDVAVDDFIPVRYLFRGPEEMPDWEIMALHECKGKVLDIGAGAGSHSLVLIDQDIECHSMDISLGAYQVMQERGLPYPIHGNIFDYQEQTFDTLLLMMNGIGLVGDLMGLNQFLQHAKTLLAPGGQILLDSSDLSYLYEDGTVEKPVDRYEGIIQYQMSFRDIFGDPFYWLYLDYGKLAKQARYWGYTPELILEGPHYEYLARLTLS
ncbi:MAG: class I SAM-dependent methyltransferase [Bacteroidota bacterium]